MRLTLMIVVLLTCVGCASSKDQSAIQNADLQKYFDAYHVNGSILIYDLKADQFFSNNTERTKAAFLPASTYKIFNSLVALETGVITDETEIIPWDGVDRGISIWNQDLDLQRALRHSVVWVYQELARRIGPERMQHYISEANYGNEDISGGIDLFWLEGGLRITSEEQIAFLKRLYDNDLPFSQRSMDIVKSILILEQTDQYTLRARTGWALRVYPNTGWFVGYLERDDNVYFFATNIDIYEPDQTDAREIITRQIFQDLGLM